MATITNPQAVRFVNERIRPLANLVQTMHRTIDQYWLELADFESLVSGNANGDTFDDGAASDGRPIVSKLDAADFKFVMEQLKDCMETDDRKAQVADCANNGLPLY